MLDVVALDRLARLARLELTSDARTAFQHHLGDFFAFVEHIQGVNTEGVEPLAHPLAVDAPIVLTLQADEAWDEVDESRQQTYARNAPAMAADLFTVPAVLD
jgi:aspartyl-tRNA(Asn)/glutamyl-tRNA(Gln) amidotransferase subunit C